MRALVPLLALTLPPSSETVVVNGDAPVLLHLPNQKALGTSSVRCIPRTLGKDQR